MFQMKLERVLQFQHDLLALDNSVFLSKSGSFFNKGFQRGIPPCYSLKAIKPNQKIMALLSGGECLLRNPI